MAQLHESLPDFDKRTPALSGVSGGAVGEAVYRGAASLADGVPLGWYLSPAARQALDATAERVVGNATCFSK